MAGEDKVLAAIQQLGADHAVGTKLITSRLDNLDRRQVEQGKEIGTVCKCLEAHRAWHDGVEQAETKAATAGAQSTARTGVAGTWAKAGLAALAMLVAAVLFVAFGIGASERERPDDVQILSDRIDALVDAMETTRLTRGP